ncbi:MAG: hypothetical protein ABIH23_25680 [bacterium]
MNRILLETLACALVVCTFYTIVWWLLGTHFFGLTNRILIGVVIVCAVLDIGAIHYLIRRRGRKKDTEASMNGEA